MFGRKSAGRARLDLPARGNRPALDDGASVRPGSLKHVAGTAVSARPMMGESILSDRNSTAARASDRAFLGTALHAPAPGRLEVLRDVIVLVGPDGAIDAIHPGASGDGMAAAARHRTAGTLRTLEPDQYLLPGMVDLHVHAPQWPQLGLALDEPLEVWLQKYTFPLEARYADLDFATAVYESLVDGLLANGTTTVMYYASIHLPATRALADICLRRSQRALIGRVSMDDPAQCPRRRRPRRTPARSSPMCSPCRAIGG